MAGRGNRLAFLAFSLLWALLAILYATIGGHLHSALAAFVAAGGIVGVFVAMFALVLPGSGSSRLSDADFLATLSNSSAGKWQDELAHRKMGSPAPIDLDWNLVTSEFPRQPITVELVDEEGTTEQSGVASKLVERLLLRYAQKTTHAQLAIIGTPGSGKTVLAVQLTVKLAQRSRDSGLVPVYVNANEWNPAAKFKGWVADQIALNYARDFPDLRPAEVTRRTEALLNAGSIIPIADGIDELADDLQRAALDAIFQECATTPFVITCRSREYRNAGGHLPHPAEVDIVELSQVKITKAVDYLRVAAPLPDAQWDDWAARLNGAYEHVEQAFATPLVIGLARFRYAEPGPGPDELLDAVRFPTVEAIENYFLDYFIGLAIQRHFPSDDKESLDKEVVRRYLRDLAHLMERKRHGKTDFSWWTLHQGVSKIGSRSLYVGSIGGIALSMSFLLFRFIQGRSNYLLLTAGTTLACLLIPIASLRFGVPPNEPKRSKFRWVGFRAADFNRSALIGGVFPLLTSLVVLTVDSQPFFTTVAASVSAFILSALAFGLVRLSTPFSANEPAVTPRSTLKVDLRATLRRGAILLVLASVGLGLVYSRDESWPRALISGVYCGFFLSIGGMAATASTWYYATNLYLRVKGQLPFPLLPFLEEAYRAQLLRKAGAVYQFRHARLRQRLVEED